MVRFHRIFFLAFSERIRAIIAQAECGSRPAVI